MAFGKVLYEVICVYLNSGGGWDGEKSDLTRYGWRCLQNVQRVLQGERSDLSRKVEAFMREELERKGVGNEQRRITFFGQLRDIFIGARVEGGSGLPI